MGIDYITRFSSGILLKREAAAKHTGKHTADIAANLKNGGHCTGVNSTAAAIIIGV